MPDIDILLAESALAVTLIMATTVLTRYLLLSFHVI